MDRWIEAIGDQPNLPEQELIAQLWGGNTSQPVTTEPIIDQINDSITITCTTPGASLAFRVTDENQHRPGTWSVYSDPIQVPNGKILEVQAHRIGYQASNVVEFKRIKHYKE